MRGEKTLNRVETDRVLAVPNVPRTGERVSLLLPECIHFTQCKYDRFLLCFLTSGDSSTIPSLTFYFNECASRRPLRVRTDMRLRQPENMGSHRKGKSVWKNRRTRWYTVKVKFQKFYKGIGKPYFKNGWSRFTVGILWFCYFIYFFLFFAKSELWHFQCMV